MFISRSDVDNTFVLSRHPSKVFICLQFGTFFRKKSNMAYQTFLGFGALIGTRETDKAVIDDFPFRLQYKVATAICFLSGALISASEFVGK